MRSKGERDRKAKTGRKRGRPTLGPRAMVKLYVRPDIAADIRALARMRSVPVNQIGQDALDEFLRRVALGADEPAMSMGVSRT